MVTIGKIEDRIGFDNGDLVYLGNKSGISQTELEENNGTFFDTNNINKFVTIDTNDNNVKKTATTSFINDAKFYTCKTNGQDYLCFRCVSCTGCYKCTGCYENCEKCNDCVKNCFGCTICNQCTSCNDCTSCHGTCTSCVSCQNCNGSTSCVSCQRCDGSCQKCHDSGTNCASCQRCASPHCLVCQSCQRCVSCTKYS